MKNLSKTSVPYNNYLYFSINEKLNINLLTIPVFYAAYKFEYLSVMLCAFITAFFHELFHIAAIKITGNTFKRIIIEPFGISAQISESSFFNSPKEMFISAAGPFFNFFTAFLIMTAKKYIEIPNLNFLLTINISMGVFNLIPALPLDGGRFLRALLSLKFGIIKSYNFMLSLSKIIITILLFTSALIIIFSPFNFTLIIISVFMLSNLCSERSALSKVILKDILSSKNVPDDIYKLKIKTITVFENTPARIILKMLSFDYFINIIVVNSNGKVLLLTTETEAINLLINNGIRAKFSDMIINKNFT